MANYAVQILENNGIITSSVSGRGYKNGAISVCVCVCQCVNALTAEQMDVWSQNLVQTLTLMTSQVSLMVKVKGPGHRAKKRDFHSFSY